MKFSRTFPNLQCTSVKPVLPANLMFMLIKRALYNALANSILSDKLEIENLQKKVTQKFQNFLTIIILFDFFT